MRRRVVLFFVQVLLIVAATSVYSYGFAQNNVPSDTTKKPATNPQDSSRNARIEQLKADSDLEEEIKYKAKDYMLLDMDAKTLLLMDGGELTYQSMTLQADSVAVNWEKNVLNATGKVDSTGKKTGRPQFEENDQKYRANEIAYNFKTQKGIVAGARTKQGEEFVIADSVKKHDDQTYYIQDGKFTSCELDTPHYYIKSKRLKIIPQDKIITGPLMLVIEEFPLPLILPFGFFPNQSGKRSGIVMPTYGESADRGFFLRDGGYYWAISDKADLLVRGDIFSKGGWRLEASTSYKKRYAYDGTFGIEYGVQKFGEQYIINGDTFADPNFSRTSNFWVRWRHNQNLSPQATLKANVSAGSSNFLTANSYNEQEYLTNTLKSTITYAQSFSNSPFRLTATLNHSQNNQTRNVTLGLPDIALTRSRLFPFKGKNAVGNKWYHKIGMNYTMNLRNQISVPDSLLDDVLFRANQNIDFVNVQGEDTVVTSQRGLDYYRNGLTHTIPISTQLSIFKYINANPSFNFKEYWYIREKVKTYDPLRDEVEEEDIYGFAAARDFNFNFNTSTRIYGIFQFKGDRQPAIRHTFQPNVGYTYKPDFSEELWGFYKEVQVDTLGNTEKYSRFEGALFGGPRRGEQQQLNFGINNILEMKVRTKESLQDTSIKDPYSRFAILDQLSLNSSYNFAADSLNLAPFAFAARTNILNNKFAIQINGAVDPYAVSPEGRRINTFRYAKNGNIGRLSTLTLNFNTRLQSKKAKGPVRRDQNGQEYPEDEWNHIQYYRDLYVDFNIPWSLNLSYILNYTNSGVFRDTTMTLNFNGDFNLTPKWKVGFTSGYDFQNKDFSYTSVSIYRDLHCWEMSMTWIPFGNRQSYNLSINVKSATLKDLKLTKRRDWQDRF